MKPFVSILLLAFASSAFAQSGTTQAVGPGCGDTAVKFDVDTNRSQHPVAKPDSGKALVYFLQDDNFFESRPRPTTRFGLNGSWVGATQSNSYFYTAVDPGEHHICAGWQSWVGAGMGKQAAAAHFIAEEGKSYFFIVRNRWLRQLSSSAEMRLEPLDSDEAQLLMTKFGFSSSRVRK